MYTPEQREAIGALGQRLYLRAWNTWWSNGLKRTVKSQALIDLGLELMGIAAQEIVSERIPLHQVPEVNDRDPWQHETRPK